MGFGDGVALTPASRFGERILKVDHAGEHGAVCIYSAQRWVASWRAPELVMELDEFLAHERSHRAIFASELARRSVGRCKAYWLCGAGGAVLGLVTGLIGRRAIHATTAAIERVVLAHLEEQLQSLSDDPAARAAVTAIIRDEQTHHDRAVGQIQQIDTLHRVLDFVVSRSTEAVIWAGMRI
jgi:ubiquinone biosynthesis monooxygenase Coq7